MQTVSPNASLLDMASALRQTHSSDLPYLQIVPPQDMLRTMRYQQMNALATLYRTGRVVWAALIQMPSENLAGHPFIAKIIYDPTGHTQPKELHQHAQKSEKAPAHFIKTDVLVWPLHLPNGQLSLPIFPILIADNTEAVTLLPARYWSKTTHYRDWLAQGGTEITPSFLAELKRTPDFWYDFRELVRPQASELPELGSEPKPYSFQQNGLDSGKIHELKKASVISYERSHEDKPSEKDIAQCLKQLTQLGHAESWRELTIAYAKLRLNSFGDLLNELANEEYNRQLNQAPLPKVAAALNQNDLSCQQIAALVLNLHKQDASDVSNTIADLYLAYMYAKGKYVPQSLSEAAKWANRASRKGDWRGTRFMAELLLAAPRATKALLSDNLQTKASVLKEQFIQQGMTAEQVEDSYRRFYASTEVNQEAARSRLLQAERQGHPQARARLMELIANGQLPASLGDSHFFNLANWLQYDWDHNREKMAKSVAVAKSSASAQANQPEKSYSGDVLIYPDNMPVLPEGESDSVFTPKLIRTLIFSGFLILFAIGLLLITK